MNSFELCKKNWRESIVGTPDSIKNADDAAKARVKGIGDKAIKAWQILKAHKNGEQTVGLFRDTPAEVSFDMTREYLQLCTLANGYATYGTECYKSPELLADILWALEWGYNHYYGKAEIENRGWRNVRDFNWHDWQIGTPRPLMEILLLLDEEIPLQKKRDYLELFNRLVPEPKDYGANKVNFGRLVAQSGILTERTELIRCGIDRIDNTYLYVDGNVNDGQGFYRDGSYVFHTRHAMNGAYGMEHFGMAIQFTEMLRGTEFAMTKKRTELLFTWLYNSFLPFFTRGEFMAMVRGRALLAGTSFGLMNNIISLFSIAEGERKLEMARLLRRLVSEHPLFEGEECSAFFGGLSLQKYLIYREMMALTDECAPPQHGFRAFNQMDRALYHGEKHTLGLAMSSSRIFNYECINHQNMDGWYIGDGMLYCYSDPFQYDAEYFRNVNHYRMPGTTADDRERALVTIAQKNEYLSSQDFVGSLSIGETGVSAMQLESYHSDGLTMSNQHFHPSGAYGGPPPAHDSTLMAKKAYFFLGDCAVCLGADINSRDNATVYTVIDNRKQSARISGGKLSGYNPLCIKADGKELSLTATDSAPQKLHVISFDSSVSYVILDDSAVNLRVSDSSPAFAEAVINHGTNPSGDTYAYAMLPNTDHEKALSFAKSPSFEIIENSEKAQLVRAENGTLYCVFWQAGTSGGITASEPMLLCLQGDRLSACDVTRKLTRATVEINGKAYTLDFSDADGKAVSISL